MTDTNGTNDTKKLPFHVRLAELYLDHIMEQRGKDLRVVTDSENQNHFWKYENGLWALMADADVAKWLEPELQLVLNEDFDLKRKSNNKLFSEATKHIIRSPAIRNPLPDFIDWDTHGKIPTKAGLIDPLTLEIEPMRKDHYCTSRLVVDYDTDAKCPRWMQMLEDAFSDQTDDDRVKSINLLQEAAGTSLISSRPKALCRALLLWGPPDSGKSGLIAVLSGLTIPPTCPPITTPIKDLSGTHGLQPFLRRGVPWVLHEAFNDNVWHLTSETKMIVSCDPIPINPKNGRIITIKPNAPAFWASNHEPKFKDPSGAMTTRMLIVKFTKRFDKENPIGVAAVARQKNPAWEPQDLILNTERAGVLNWALAGLQRALQRGCFVNTTAGEDILKEIHSDSNVVAGFVEDCIDYDDNAMISSVDFYAAFSKWWKEQHGDEKGRLNPSLVGRHLADLGDPLIVQNKSKFKNRKGLRFYIGIKLNEAGKEFFESCLSESFNEQDGVRTELARMSKSYAETIRPIFDSWLHYEEIGKLKAAAKAA
jgi:P4 family phage/plasmid primase-like protien